jgi:hypothetical protein
VGEAAEIDTEVVIGDADEEEEEERSPDHHSGVEFSRGGGGFSGGHVVSRWETGGAGVVAGEAC